MKYICLAILLAFSLCGAEYRHGLSIDKELKYKKNFKHFEYVNIDAIQGGTLKSYVLGTFDSLNMFAKSGNSASELDLLYDTLLVQSLDESFSAYGLVAQSMLIADDLKSVIFKINKNAKFNDKVPITSEDVKFSFETLIQKGNIQYKRYYEGVKNVEIIDKYTIKFNFKDATNKELPLILGQLAILPKHFYVKNGVNTFDDNALEIPLGSGPYVIDKYNIGRSITYKKAKNYWAKDLNVRRGFFNFEYINVEYYKDPNVAQRAFMARAYDWRIESSAKVWANEYKSSDSKLQTKSFKHTLPAAYQGFFFNTRLDKFKDIRVREAISLAFDFEWSNKNLFFNQYKRTTNIFTNSIFESHDLPQGLELEILNRYKDKLDNRIFTQVFSQNVGGAHQRQNLLKAQQILKDAGYKIKNGILYDKSNHPFRFTILLSSNVFERIALPFVANLKRLGIQADIHTIDDTQYINAERNFDYDMVVGLLAQSLNPGNEQIYYWGSESAFQKGSKNYAGIEDKVVDELIYNLINAKDKNTQIAYAKALDRVLLWGFYSVAHYHLNSYRIAWWADKITLPNTLPPYGFTPYLWWSNINMLESK